MVPGFPITIPIEVRWRDVDAFGHVNNAVFFTYLEMGRTAYYEAALKAFDIDQIDFMVVSAKCDYLSEVKKGDKIELGIRIPAIGNTSFDFEYELHSATDGKLLARGFTTQVLYDYKARAKKPISQEWLEKVTKFEGREPVRRG